MLRGETVLGADPVSEDFVDRLVEKVGKIKMGDPLAEDTDLGPLISERAAERVHREVEQSIEMGAECLIGKTGGKEFLFAHCPGERSPEMPCFCGEIFGPVAPISPINDIREAIDEINSTPFGLQATVFSDNIHDALGVAHRLEVGGVVVNGAGSFRPGNVPFGGFKLSGTGRESIKETVLAMTQETAIVLNQRRTF